MKMLFFGKILLLFCFIFGADTFAIAQENDIVGTWKTIDDETEKERSWVEIYKQGTKYFGKITKIYLRPGEKPDAVCEKCTDHRKNQKVMGLVIIENMQKQGDVWTGGKILDPSNGQVYSCKMWLEQGVLKVRGYWGIFYRTQNWYRVK
ncbi:MAG: DUF2147 domain-containing protein [Microscillaceae bacterium]|nr:DUF2147 domain-containing protein [Microscillaceae bacterium]MDW8459851.1 DUF2147 domain-containing protein [Cytophagales bacterium]